MQEIIDYENLERLIIEQAIQACRAYEQNNSDSYQISLPVTAGF